MTKHEIISYIKDEMLSFPEIDVTTVYQVAEHAVDDSFFYNLMTSWMETTEETEKRALESIMNDAAQDVLKYGTYR